MMLLKRASRRKSAHLFVPMYLAGIAAILYGTAVCEVGGCQTITDTPSLEQATIAALLLAFVMSNFRMFAHCVANKSIAQKALWIVAFIIFSTVVAPIYFLFVYNRPVPNEQNSRSE